MELSEEGYLKVDPFEKFTKQGIFVCGEIILLILNND